MTAVATSRLSVVERWRNLHRVWRVVIALAAASVALELLVGEVGAAYSSPNTSANGPSSSLDTSPAGTAALAALMKDRRHPVIQLTQPLGQANLPAKDTVFVLDPVDSITIDARKLRQFVANGGHLVVGGRPASGFLASLFGTSTGLPRWFASSGGIAHPVVHNAYDAGIDSVVSVDGGSWLVPREPRTQTLLAFPGSALALAANIGTGSVVLLADDGAFSNAELTSADDAGFALDLAGPAGATVVFDEYDHGFGRRRLGLAGLPGHWRAALVLGALAAVIWIVSAARRLGPPQLAERPMVPARVAHVDALAALLASGPPETLGGGAAPLQQRARELLGRLLHAPAGATDDDLRRLAGAAADPAAPPQLVASALATPTTTEGLLSLSRALTELERRASTKGPDL